MGIFDKWTNPVEGVTQVVNNVVDVVDQFVVDKDQAARLKNELSQLKEYTYQKELDTPTIPWVDALHKMGRQIMSLVSMIVGVYLLHVHPDINPASLAMVMGPFGIYAAVKGKGNAS